MILQLGLGRVCYSFLGRCRFRFWRFCGLIDADGPIIACRREVEEAFRASVESIIVRISSVAGRGGAQVSGTILSPRAPRTQGGQVLKLILRVEYSTFWGMLISY